MSAANVWMLLLFAASLVLCVGLLLAESWRWAAFRGAPGHRPGELMKVATSLRKAGIRVRIQNTTTIGSEAAIGAGMSTTLLVLKRDLARARRVVAEARTSSHG